MEFLKNHYEKVVLGVVLAGLAAVAAMLPMKISADKQNAERVVSFTKREPDEREPVDLSEVEGVRQEVSSPPSAKFAGSHNTFNSVVWRKMPDGNLIKLRPEDVGVNKLQVESVSPLNFIVEFDKVSGTGYYFNVTREDAPLARDRRKRSLYLSPSNTGRIGKVLTLEEVRGEASNPLAFVLKVTDTDESIVVSASRPYHSTNGYSATILYPPEKKTWADVRNKEPLIFAGDTNIIVDINPAEVILRAVSNEKTTTITVN